MFKLPSIHCYFQCTFDAKMVGYDALILIYLLDFFFFLSKILHRTLILYTCWKIIDFLHLYSMICTTVHFIPLLSWTTSFIQGLYKHMYTPLSFIFSGRYLFDNFFSIYFFICLHVFMFHIIYFHFLPLFWQKYLLWVAIT